MAIKGPGAAHLESREITDYLLIPLLLTRNLFHMISGLYIVVVTLESAWTPFAELYGSKRVDAAVEWLVHQPMCCVIITGNVHQRGWKLGDPNVTMETVGRQPPDE